MWLTYKQLLRFIFPPSADERILEAADRKHLLHYHTVTQHGVTTLLPYRDEAVRAALHLAKFHHHPEALLLLGERLADHLKTAPVDLIVPVPLGAKRERERGYNQVVEVLKAAKQAGATIPVAPKLLKRQRHTRPQTELTTAERKQNLRGAFVVNERAVPENIHNLHILLIDDVVTTGSTLAAAAAALQTVKPASLTRLALAR